jgi:chromosome segregation protein
MDISKLTVQGFKSFYEKATFTFGKNITAIVGPNGSGKSNITESIRFVLGEQSTKSLRGKDITDLLFRGPQGKANKARAEIVFSKSPKSKIHAGNIENIFVKNALEKDEVVIARTVFLDGKSFYEINGVEVRLKDVQEFLLYVHLGNKSSWHISQGEADRVLSANPLERKTLIEDALGLKVYHSRINESQRKLEKTKENIREASIQRKEIMPELSALSRLVEKIKKSGEFREELKQKANIFVFHKKKSIEVLKNSNTDLSNIDFLDSELLKLEKSIGEAELELSRQSTGSEDVIQSEIQKEEKVLSHLQNLYLDLDNEKRKIQNNISYYEVDAEKSSKELKDIETELANLSTQGNDIIFSETDIDLTKNEIEEGVESIKNTEDKSLISQTASSLDHSFKKLLTKGSVVTKDNVKQVSYLNSIKLRLQEKLREANKILEESRNKIFEFEPKVESEKLKIKLSEERLEALKKELMAFKFENSEKERIVNKLTLERGQLLLKISNIRSLQEKVTNLDKELQTEILDIKNILGEFEIIDFSHEENITDEELTYLKRSIERLKLRLEESIVSNPDEVMDKHTQLSDRDQFLIKEIGDLESSILNLEKLIIDLKESLKRDFDIGLEHINKIFDSYVKRLFSGGSAKVFVTEIENRRKKDDMENEEEGEEEVKIGVEVEVEIPKKKVKGLHALSGGERALVSIALNFSIINQNPAPFMILDETDAALDEANSKRYGEILDMLKNETKLIVVTHNRETMHFADQIYGVTLHKDGHSKVLSVAFDDAVEYAK